MSEVSYRASIARATGVEPGRFDAAGTSVCPADDRRGSLVVSHYRIGRHSLLWCDPALARRVAPLQGSARALTRSEFGDWAVADGAELVGSGFEHALPDEWVAPQRSAGVERLEGRDGATSETAAVLLEACTEEERDDADFDLDALDPFLVGRRDGQRLVALAGARVWAPRPGLHDLGVIVHPDHRGRGFGSAVVAALTAEVIAGGEIPLYRCNQDNVGSWRLCRSVGYRLVAELDAYRWAAP